MADVTARNWVFLVLSIVCVIPGCALLWRVFDNTSLIDNELERLAQYEVCGFLFYVLTVCAAVVYASRSEGKSASVLLAISIGVMLYITIFSQYLSFTVLNNLRIVDMSGQNDFFLPNNLSGQPLNRGNQTRYLAGLILGWFALFFGLIASVTGECKKPGIVTKIFWLFALVLLITGNVVCWSSNSASTYSTTYYNDEKNLFFITTLVMVQWLVLTAGMCNGSVGLVSSSGFIFGVAGIFIPIQYFFIQSNNQSNSEYLWAGPVLCWVSSMCMAVAAAMMDVTPPEPCGEPKKEASV